MPLDEKYKRAIRYLYDIGLLQVENKRIMPFDRITRVDMVEILSRVVSLYSITSHRTKKHEFHCVYKDFPKEMRIFSSVVLLYEY